MPRLLILLLLFSSSSVLYASSTFTSSQPGTPLTQQQHLTVQDAINAMKSSGLLEDSLLASTLLRDGIWRAASTDDPYIGGAEKSGDTPFAYTLSPGHKPIAIVFAARFFNSTTQLARAAVMIHEIGHYKAYVKTGRSDEYDGYKEEYDNYRKLGLSEKDGLVYFAMLDGTAQYVVPRVRSYASHPDLAQFMTN